MPPEAPPPPGLLPPHGLSRCFFRDMCLPPPDLGPPPDAVAGRGHAAGLQEIDLQGVMRHGVETQPFFGYVSTLLQNWYLIISELRIRPWPHPDWSSIEAIPTADDYSWDNNQIERINRYVSLSRKNSLFFGSHAGAERGCIFYSLACSCRLHHINFFEYLSDILNRMSEMPNGTPVEAFRNLLPDKWPKKELSK